METLNFFLWILYLLQAYTYVFYSLIGDKQVLYLLGNASLCFICYNSAHGRLLLHPWLEWRSDSLIGMMSNLTGGNIMETFCKRLYFPRK